MGSNQQSCWLPISAHVLGLIFFESKSLRQILAFIKWVQLVPTFMAIFPLFFNWESTWSPFLSQFFSWCQAREAGPQGPPPLHARLGKENFSFEWSSLLDGASDALLHEGPAILRVTFELRIYSVKKFIHRVQSTTWYNGEDDLPDPTIGLSSQLYLNSTAIIIGMIFNSF